MKEEEAEKEVAATGDVKEDVKRAEAAGEASDGKNHSSAKSGSPSLDDDKDAPTTKEEQEHGPNSTPRMMDPDEDTYVYRDFSAIPPPTMSEVGSLHPQSLQAQKLPAKLASMLADHGMFYTQHKSLLISETILLRFTPIRSFALVFLILPPKRSLSSTHKRIDFRHRLVAARAKLEGPQQGYVRGACPSAIFWTQKLCLLRQNRECLVSRRWTSLSRFTPGRTCVPLVVVHLT